MKIFVLILATVLLSSQAEAKDFKDVTVKVLNDILGRSLSDKLYNKIQSLKAILKNGNETYGIPIMDPFKVQHDELTLDTEVFKGFAAVDNLIFTGLAEYNIEQAEVSVIRRKISVTLRWPLLEEKNSYKVNGTIGTTPDEFYLFGSGDTQFKAEEFKFAAEVYFGLNGGSVYIKNMNSNISLDNFKFNITGLFNDEDLSIFASDYISNLVLKIVRDHQTELVTAVNNQVITYVNEFLSGLSFSELLDLIS